MDLKYDIPRYITSVKMSSKKRVLVEGRDDKSHIKNLLDVLSTKHRVKIDTAENLKGDCARTAKNNRAKIEKVHDFTKNLSTHENLYFLCDREFFLFEIKDQIYDLMLKDEDEGDGNLNWTIGHSLENYFIKDDLICRAYRFLCGSEYKNDTEILYRNNFSSILKIIATVTLAAKNIDKSSYPAGTISWESFRFDGDELFFDINEWKINNKNEMAEFFYEEYNKSINIIEKTDSFIHSKICRGHTAMLLLQRAFAACLNEVAKKDDSVLSYKLANDFSKLKESSTASALCESWLQSVSVGEAIYPERLVRSLI